MSEQKDRRNREKIADEYYDFTVKQGWKLAGFERDIRAKSYEYADQIIAFFPDELAFNPDYLDFKKGVEATEEIWKVKAEEARKQSDKRVKFVARQLVKIYKRRIEEAKREEGTKLIEVIEGAELKPEEIENITENVALSYIGEKARKAKEGDFEKEVRKALVYHQLQAIKALLPQEDCPDCKGTGRGRWCTGQHDSGYLLCPKCNGTGRAILKAMDKEGE